MSAAAEVPSRLRRALGTLAAFLAMNVVGALTAMVIAPLVAPQFGGLMRNPARDELQVPALLSGYAVVAIALALLLGGVEAKPPGRSARLGLTLGLAVFLGGHLITAGWSVMPVAAMALSGVVDSLAVAFGAAAFSWVLLVRTKAENAHAY